MKKAILRVAKFLLFVAVFLSMYTFSRDVLRNKSESEALGVIMQQPDRTYDVVLAGPSHMQYAVQPAQLFGEQGIAACNVSTAAQSIPTSYYVIKEMIDRHEPRLVVLDLFCLFYPDNYFAPARFHQAIDNFPLSANKTDAILNLAKEDKSEYFLNYLLYHNRWKELKRFDYTIHDEKNETFQYLIGNTAFTTPFVPAEGTAEIPEVPLTYLKKLVTLCKETDTELLLTVIPYRGDVDNNNTSAVLQQQMYNTVEKLAEEWGVDYFNGLHHLEDFDFDFTTDMREFSHVNLNGGHKVSAFYGEYLRKHYDIPDHSDDPAYAHWNEDYAEYLELLKSQNSAAS